MGMLCRASSEPGVSAPSGLLGHIVPAFSAWVSSSTEWNSWQFPQPARVGKEAGVNVICVVLSSAAGDVKLREGSVFVRSLEAKCAKFHTRDRPGRGRSHYKEIHCQVPPPTSSLESFQLLESLEAPWQKPRDNAFRARGGETSRNEAGEETQNPRKRMLLPTRGRRGGFLRAPCSQCSSGIHPFVKPENDSQLRVG